ncbi:unnamed protein product [Knipowitschia caucasica]
MPVLMDDPTLLTRADAPGGNPPRDVLLQLYVKTVSHGPGVDTFSSDEEQEPPVVYRSHSSGRLAPKMEVSLLTDEALRDQLRGLGVHAGPIVASTRKLYERKLQLLREKTPETEKNQELYEVTTVSDPVPDPVSDPVLELELEQKETVRSYRSNSSQKRSTGATEQEKQEEDPTLSELRLTAICRRPIRGAAGRPVVPSDRSQSTLSTASSVLRSSSARSSSSSSSSSSLKPSSAPSVPAGRRDTAWWKKLLLWLVLAAFLFFVYQAMESNSPAPIE